jgi:hypothetical protein
MDCIHCIKGENKVDRKTGFLAVAVIALIGGMGLLMVFLPEDNDTTTTTTTTTTTSEPINIEPLEPVPPLNDTPSLVPFNSTIGNLTIGATPLFVFYMLHSGNSYSLIIDVVVVNNGPATVTNFNASKASVYFDDSSLFFTFSLITSDCTTMEPGATHTIRLTPTNFMPDVPTLIGTYFQYVRIQVTTGEGLDFILTTPLAQVAIVIE